MSALPQSVLASLSILAAAIGGRLETSVDAHAFRVVDGHSGPVNYYEVVDEKDPKDSFIHAAYKPGLETVTLGYEAPERLRHGVRKIRWSWRAIAMPTNGNECKDGFGDSAAIVYVSFKRGLKWYSLKYVWSSDTATKGMACMQKDNLFVSQRVIVLEAGGPMSQWRTEEVDIADDFRRAFENGNPNAEIPPFAGIGLMSDGDQTNSFSAADYKGFTFIEG